MNEFDEIRPYHDHEVPEVMTQLIKEPLVFKLMNYLFPELTRENLIEMARKVKTIRDLQVIFSRGSITRISERTSEGITCSGFEHFSNDTPSLIISNHRDIILDSALLNVARINRGFDTVESGTGDNLMMSPVVAALMRLNRTFVIHRSLSGRKLVTYSQRLSRYIRYQVTQNNTSVWIAQRNGRTKDGIDQTDTALLKLFAMSENDFVKGFSELRILPMAISYEYDPCDSLKAYERYLRAIGTYEKSKKDDFKSMMAGVTSQKGKMHISIGAPIKEELEDLVKIVNKNERYRAFAELMDQRIRSLYQVHEIHYIAADLKTGGRTYSTHYTSEQKTAFEAYIHQQLSPLPGDQAHLRSLFLDIYANPVIKMS